MTPVVKPMEIDDDHPLSASSSSPLLDSLIKFKRQIREAAEINLDEYKKTVKNKMIADFLVSILLELKKIDSAFKTIKDNDLLSLPDLPDIIKMYQSFFESLHTPSPVSANFDALKLFLSPLCPYLVKESKRFNCEREVQTDCSADGPISALNHYLVTADSIRADKKAFKSSPFGLLERMLVDKETICKDEFPEVFAATNFSTESCFFALAAPSLEGKTQSAFVLEDVKPLYFPLCSPYGSGGRSSQFIYQNYAYLAFELKKLAGDDMQALEAEVLSRNLLVNPKETVRITDVGFLRNKCRKVPFWTLGFLLALADHMKSKAVKNSGKKWMDILASGHDFIYSPVSIEDAKRATDASFKDICVFLDEFDGDDPAVLIRNLCRSINLNCLVANTNALVTNLVGKSNMSGSRGAIAWSIVFSKLNSADFTLEVYSQQQQQPPEPHPLNVLINQILAHRQWPEDQSEDPVLVFLRGMVSNLLRPGVAELLINGLKVFIERKMPALNPNYSVVELADSVCIYLALRFRLRKPAMQTGDHGILAKFGLLFNQAFERIPAKLISQLDMTAKKAEERKRSLWNHRSYLSEHLFYLSNPQDTQSNVFLTFAKESTGSAASTGSTAPTAITSSSAAIDVSSVPNAQAVPNEPHLDVYTVRSSDHGSIADRTPWLLESTHFDDEDLCTLLGCFFVPINVCLSSFLLRCKTFTEFKPPSMYDAPNEALESQNSGNELEVTSSCIISESSRHFHPPNDVNYTLAGQDGLPFVQNIVRNCISNIPMDGNTIVPSINLTLPEKLQAFLARCKIPFIYGWNRKIPFLEHLTDLTATTPDSDSNPIFAASLTRCANIQEIDISFPMKLDGIVLKATAECKNYHKSLHAGDLISIVSKALKHEDSRLSLIFTKSASLTLKSSKRSFEATQQEEQALTAAEEQARIAKQEKKLQSDLITLCNGDVLVKGEAISVGEKKRKVNLYRVLKLSGCWNFEVELFNEDFTEHPEEDEPLNCIIFETDRITYC